MTKNRSSRRWVVLSTVTWRSPMASSSADWVLGDARLISSARTMFENTGPGRKSKVPLARFQTVMPTTSAGSRSGVNCTRPNVALIDAASALPMLVLPTPGASSSRMWPSAMRLSTARWMTSRFPRMVSSMLSQMALNTSAKVSAWLTGACVVTLVRLPGWCIGGATQNLAPDYPRKHYRVVVNDSGRRQGGALFLRSGCRPIA